MWKYNLKSNCVEEQPTIEMPNNNYDFPPDGPSDSMLRSAIDHFDEEWGKYNNHCNSLRSIPVSGKVNWEDGQEVVELRQFVFQSIPNSENGLYMETFAFPLVNPQPKEHKSDENSLPKSDIKFCLNCEAPNKEGDDFCSEICEDVYTEKHRGKADIEQEAEKSDAEWAAIDEYPVYPMYSHLLDVLPWGTYIDHLRLAFKKGAEWRQKMPLYKPGDVIGYTPHTSETQSLTSNVVEAIEFAEWIDGNFKNYAHHGKYSWGKIYPYQNTMLQITTKELYEIFKNK